jgi:MFS family permease
MGVLASSQALGGLGLAIGIAVAAVLAEDVSGSETLSGLVQTFQVIGAAAGSYTIASIMGRRGRRLGLLVGYGTGAVGAALCVLGGVTGSFAVLLLGATLFGAISATNNQSRYVAADLAQPHHRARALSIVLWATTFGAVTGPNLTGVAGDLARWLGLPELTGPFLISVPVIGLAMAVVALLLRPDPLLLAREIAGDTHPDHHRRLPFDKLLAVVRRHPGTLAGVLALASAHPVMIAVMVMTPLHMRHGGAAISVIGFVISVHIVGMYFFSPVAGWGADRIGPRRMLVIGAGVLLASLLLAGTSPEGNSPRITVGLFLLGLGWSFCTVAGSALVTESTPIEVRPQVQGAADLTMNLSAAAAGLLAGVVVGSLGYAALNVFAALFVLGVLAAAVLANREPALTEV